MKRDDLDELLDAKLAKFFRQITKHVDGRIGELRDEMAERFDHLEVTVDGIAHRLHTDDQERAATNSQLDRHEGYFKQLAKATNTKLVPEQ